MGGGAVFVLEEVVLALILALFDLDSAKIVLFSGRRNILFFWPPSMVAADVILRAF